MKNLPPVFAAIDSFSRNNYISLETETDEMMYIGMIDLTRETYPFIKLGYPSLITVLEDNKKPYSYINNSISLPKEKDQPYWEICYMPTKPVLDGDFSLFVYAKTLKVEEYEHNIRDKNWKPDDYHRRNFRLSNEKRTKMIYSIDTNIISYLRYYKYNSSAYTLLFLDRAGVFFNFKSKNIREYVDCLRNNKIEYVTAIIESKTEKPAALCFILNDKSFKILKVFKTND